MLPLMRDGFSLDDSPVAKELLVKFRLMRDFHLHVSKYWIRYPSESLMENVISTTISLFSVKMNATVTGRAANVSAAFVVQSLDTIQFCTTILVTSGVSKKKTKDEIETKDRRLKQGFF